MKIILLVILTMLSLSGCADIAKRTVYQSFQSAACRDRVKNFPNDSRQKLECISGNRPGTMSYDDYQTTRKGAAQPGADGISNSQDESVKSDEEFNLPDGI